MLKKSYLKRGNNVLRKTPLKRKFKVDTPEEKFKKEKRTEFYRQCAVAVGVVSAISGKRFKEPSRINYHHTWPKSKFPEVEFCFEVILPVTMDEHSVVESNPEAFKENIEKKIYVCENWEHCKNLSKLWELEYEKQIADE